VTLFSAVLIEIFCQKVFIDDPKEGHVYESPDVVIHVSAKNVPPDKGYSGMSPCFVV